MASMAANNKFTAKSNKKKKQAKMVIKIYLLMSVNFMLLDCDQTE